MEITIEYQPILEAPAASDKRRNTSDEPRATINMQNKPNLLNARMNVTSFYTVDYENKSNWKLGENKPNSKPIKANTNPIKANTRPIQTQYKAKQSQFQRQKNAASTFCRFYIKGNVNVWNSSLFR